VRHAASNRSARIGPVRRASADEHRRARSPPAQESSLDITSVPARTLVRHPNERSRSDEPAAVSEEPEGPSRSRHRPRGTKRRPVIWTVEGVSSRRPDRPARAPPAQRLAARLACRSRIEMSAIGSVCVVVKVPVAAVMCDRNAGAEGSAVDAAGARAGGLRHARMGVGGGWPAVRSAPGWVQPPTLTLVRDAPRFNS
jgi:hypothetical protein